MPRPARADGATTRVLVPVLVVVLLGALLTVVPVTAASAAITGTVLFQNSFANNTVDGTGTLTVPKPVGGTNSACLSAAGNTTTGPLLSCPTSTDAQGNGRLRLTAATGNQIGGVFGAASFPTSNGLDVTFTTYQYGGNAADGMTFVLAAVDPANPAVPTAIGPGGGSLGYSPFGSLAGLSNAYLGIGLDVYGNYSSPSFSGSGCTPPSTISAQVSNAVVVRGPGNASTGYCPLTSTYDGTAASKVALRASTRAASAVPVQVLINPTATTFVSETGQSAAAGTYKVILTPAGATTARTLTGTLPSVPSTLYPSTSWLSSAGVPRQLAFGFIGSTGGSNDFHEAANVRVLTFNPVPQLRVSTTSYAAASPSPGGPVTYVATAGVQTGADEGAAISVTQSVPTGIRPVSAAGSGWVCQAPSGQSVTCTTSATSFPAGTSLPPVTINAVVTSASVTSATIATSTTTVSSTDGNPASATPTAGPLPAAPGGIAVSPVIGPIAGGGSVTVTGSNITSATAIEIGTTAEQQAGTPVTLVPCSSTVTTRCFTVSGNSLVIASMPARAAAAAVTVTVVTNGVSGSGGYTYADKPVAVSTPTATAGTTSATVTWVAPADNGSPITGYSITPFRAGVAQTQVVVDASTTTRTLTGLTAGSSYTFTVTATNAYGTSAASPASAAVVPYDLPSTPTVTAATAGTGQATLTWTTPAANGSPISGYVITPYIGNVAQPAVGFDATTTTRTITGLTPGTAYTFTVAAQNAAGTGPPSARSSAVTPNRSPSLPFTSVPAGEVGVAYAQQLTVDNGTSPFTWAISSGTLPAGINLAAATGRLAGTPTAAGSFPVTVQVTDASGQTASRAVTLVIGAAPTVTFAPAGGEVGVAYSQQPTVSGGTGPFSWDITAGSLPAGLTLDPATGTVRGTPTAAGSSTVTVRVTDGFAQTASRTVTLAIAAQPTLPATPPPSGQVGVAYSTTFTVTGGTAPFSWALTAGSLPTGLTLNSSTGQLTGTPTTAGSSTFTLAVTDAFGQTASRPYTVTVTPGPLVITTTADSASTTPGATVTWTQTIANTSSTAFTGVQVRTSLSAVLDDATYLTSTASAGTLGYAAPTLTWTGNLAAGATVTVTFSARVSNPDVGDKVLTAAVTSPTLGTNCATGAADPRCTATVTVAGLNIVKTADVATTTPGGTVRYRIDVTNTGQTAYGTADLTDDLAGVLDDATYLVDGSATTGSLSVSGSTLSWTGALPVGASTTITYSVRVNDPVAGNRSLTGAVVSPTAGSTCPAGGGAAQCSPVVTVLVPALAVSTTTDVTSTTPGSVVTYRTTAANTGQTAYTGASVTIALDDVLDDADLTGTFTAPSGTVSYDPVGRRVTWTGDLPLGASVVITGAVTVRDPDTANRTLVSTTSSSAPGSTCPVGSTRSACTTSVSVLVPALTITQAADTASTTPGSVVRYTVTATNTGQTAYLPAAVTVDLTRVLDDATYQGDAAASSGTVGYTGPRLTWTGNLAVGATATITYSVAVATPNTGDKLLVSAVSSPAAGSSCPPGGTAAGCATSVPVLIPGLTITTTVDTATTTPGSVVSFRATVANTGQTPYTGAVVTLDRNDIFDDATPNADSRVTTGDLQIRPDGFAIWTLNLAPGSTATITLSVTVKDPDTGNRLLRPVLTSDAAGSNCPTGGTAAACTSRTTVLIPGLTLTKTASATTVTPGDRIDYTVRVVNTGEAAYGAASFTDPLAQVLSDARITAGPLASAGTVTVTTNGVEWTGALQPGESAVVTYSVTVLDPDPGDKLITGTLMSTTPGSNCAAGTTDPRCTAAVTVLVPALTITKSVGSPTSVPGGTVTSTLVVTNSGPTPYTGATVTDALARALDDAVYDSDATATSGSVTVTGSTLTWTGDLAVGASATVRYSLTVNAADVGDDHVTTVATSTARGNNCGAGSADLRCTTDVPVARLTIVRTQDRATATPGSVINIPATYTNTGAVPYFGITVTHPRGDSADDVYATGDDSATSGQLARTDTAITWTGDIPVGGSVTVSITRTVRDPDPGNKIATATIYSDAPGNNCRPGSTDPRCTYRIDIVIPKLTITKTASTTAARPGQSVTYTVTVDNTGQTPYTGATVGDSLVGLLDDAAYNNDAVASGGTVSYAAPVLTWVGDLAVGARAVITYSVTVPVTPSGDKTMVNTVSSTATGSSCPPGGGGAGCQVTVLVLTQALTMTKTADVRTTTLGSTVVYTLTVTNTGQIPYSAASFDDRLADVLDDATFDPTRVTATAGSTSFAGGVLSWSGALGVGQSATVTYPVVVRNPDPGNKLLLNTLSSGSAGSNCAVGSTDPRCTATVVVTDAVTLTLTKTADVRSTVAGAVVRFTVTAVNSSDSVISGADFTDPLAGVLDDADYRGDLTASSGTASSTGGNVRWTGSVPVGGTVTVTYSVAVHTTTTGDQVLRGTLTSTAPSASNNCLAGSTDPRCTETVTVAGLVIEQHYLETSTTPGSLVHLTATFTNTGSAPYTGITIFSPSGDTVDDAVPTGDQTASSGSLTLDGTGITWSGNIPVGGVVTVTGTLTVKNPDPGNKLLTGTLVTDAPGSNCPRSGTDPRCTAALPVLLPGLTLTLTGSVTTATPGSQVGYTITIANTGQTPYAGATVTNPLAGLLDDATYDNDAVASSGRVTFADTRLTWTGDLAVGATASITYSVTVRRPAVGDKILYSMVRSSEVGSTCPPGSSTPACLTSVTVLLPALTVTASADRSSTVPGAVVTYTLTATNTGQTSYRAARFTAPMTGILDDAIYAGDAAATSGAVTVTAAALTWTGPLAPGEAATVIYSVTVGPPGAGDRRLVQALTSTNQGSTCTPDDDDPRCATSVPIAGLRILNRAAVSTTLPTGVVRTTVTFTNIGQVPYVGVTLTDSFVDSLDDATYNGDATASSGSLIIVPGSGQVVWTGDVPLGATVTVTGSVTVKNPDPANQVVGTRVATDVPGSNCPPAGTDPDCVTSVPVLTPALVLSTTADTVTTTPGSLVGYTVTITNSGQTPYTGAQVRTLLDGISGDAVYQGDAVASSGTVVAATAALVWTGDLAVGGSVVITYSVRVDNPDLGGKVLRTRVVSDELGSSCPTVLPGTTAPVTSRAPGASCSNEVTVLVPALVLSVVADRTTTEPGDAVGYTVTIANTGQTNALGARATVDLAGVLDAAALDGPPAATVGQVTVGATTFTWTGDLPVGTTAVITYRVVVADPAAGDRALTTALSSPAPGSTCTETVPCLSVVAVLVPGLDVALTADVATTTPGSQVAFTVSITDTGQTSYSGTTVSVPLAGVLDDATLVDGLSATVGIVQADGDTLVWTGSLAPGDQVVIGFAARVADPVPGDRVLTASVLAPAAGSTCRLDSVDPRCAVAVAVLIPALTITTTPSAPTTTPGGVVGYRLLITNTGETAYAGAAVSESLAGLLADASYNGDATVTGPGVVGYAEPAVTWTGDLPVGASATVTFSVTVLDPDPGDKNLTAVVTSTVPGSSCLPGGSAVGCSSTVLVLVPGLTIQTFADATAVAAGQPVRYTVRLTNTGQTRYEPATVTDSLAGVLDDAVWADDATATTGTVDFADGTLAWTGALGVGESATITYSVITRFPAAGDRTMATAVSSASPGSTCPTAASPGCSTLVTVLVPALTVAKAADTAAAVAGGAVRYTVTAVNTGQADYPAVELVDDLSGVLDDAGYRGDATATVGTVTVVGTDLRWDGALPVGASVVVTYSVDVPVDVDDGAVLVNRVTSTATGSTCVTGSEAGCVTSTPIAARFLTLTGLTSSITLRGLPDSQVTLDGAVVMTVLTNSATGYLVTVRARGDRLTGTTPGNTDTIPIGRVGVRGTAQGGDFASLSADTPVVVGERAGPASPGGDAVSNDYRVDIPFVDQDTYSGTLEYIVGAP
ncbi:DUF11 domain-containing protein [Nakamurella flavida]|uniref:DUF11 domain-containing protein n=1 Tax=Nakamurella flavida TaxID=363630 RepID=A0A939C3D4_9ACTN|nr:putative Ig domain-containing protein [Nakamurella flavida]MBM9477525.1 DUF11 domain-containing protein [Nakamurella flavida]MDP9777458.1 putative repeat protein (TIGR01451 family) [Nakamurella flavida]